MKKLIYWSFPLWCCIGLMMACNTTQQRITYNTLASVEATATATADSFDAAAIKGLAPKDKVPVVGAAFNQFQASFLLALDLAQNNSNALAPTNLVLELNDFLKVVSTFYTTNAPSNKTITPTP